MTALVENSTVARVLPGSHWPLVRLSAIGKTFTGSTPPKAQKEYYGGDFPFVKPGELVNRVVHDSLDKLSEAGAEVADVAPEGSVLVSCIGNLGKTALAGRPVAFNQQINAVIPNEPETGKWIFYAVQSPDFLAQLTAVSSATTISIVNKSKFSALNISWATLPEQRRIVAEIEKQFTRLDAGVVALRRVQANLKRYRAAVLKAACGGRLVPTEADLAKTGKRKAKFETGTELLNRILTERRNNWSGQRKYKEPATIEPATLPKIPEGWTWTTIEQLVFLDLGFAFKSAEFEASGIKLLRGENLEPGKFRWNDTRYWPKSKLDEFKHLLIKEGEIVLAMDRPLISSGLKIARARSGDVPCLLVQRMARFRPIIDTMTPFLFCTLNTDHFIRHLVGGQQGTQLPHISGDGIQSFPIALPPLAEQKRIVSEVERRLSVIDELETVVTANLQRATRLRQSILQQAFTGDL